LVDSPKLTIVAFIIYSHSLDVVKIYMYKSIIPNINE
jgi:hypothetical protein